MEAPSPLKLVLLAMVLSPPLFAHHVPTNFSHYTAHGDRVSLRRTRRTTNVKVAELVKMWLPPPELFPPILKDVPTVTDAGSSALQIEFHTAKKNGDCPARILWIYKGKDERMILTMETANMKNKHNMCNETLVFQDLLPETLYYIQAKPMSGSGTEHPVWYSDGDTPSGYLSLPALARTCSRQVPPITHLQIHSSGKKWMALSWIPPKCDCITQLQYRVKYSSEYYETAGMYLPMGTFWSHKLQNVEGSVSPCVAWPDRHCLVLAMDMDEKKLHIVTIQVRRIWDRQESSGINATFKITEDSFVPCPPVDLHCAEAQATSLEVRWRCPLVLGGRLDKVHIQVNTSDGRFVRHITQNAILRPEYVQKIEGLHGNVSYNVSVWFVTTSGKEGHRASRMVWTSASHQPPTTSNSSTSTEASTTDTTWRSAPALPPRPWPNSSEPHPPLEKH